MSARVGLEMIVDSVGDLEVAGHASDAAQAVELARRLDPDVVLMDIRMPSLDGIEATRHITAGAAGHPRVEREVLKLIARGLTDAELAQRLYLSEKTVKTHVERILMKLGLCHRVQAVVFAYEAGIVVPGRE